MENLKANLSININASGSRVWEALTDPALIKQYLFDSDTISDWKKGSTITWSGVYEGKQYQDKGSIIEIEPEKLLHISHYSPLSGKPDIPENYHHVVYQLTSEKDFTTLTLTQDNVSNKQELEHVEGNWNAVLQGIKKLLED